ncbi:MAG: T9SS type A sorting domain-containing protein [Cytophagales bacterium]|nr:T9SS type A sorting domain-containing protein [Cytophagales bacterium]
MILTDDNGCQGSGSVIINNLPAVSASITGTNASCPGICDGAADLTPTGGTTPYTYLWSNGATTQDVINICAGTYSVTVTDDNGCQDSASVTINNQTTLSSTILATDISCNGTCDGEADLTVTGGLNPISYSWSNGETTEDIFNLCAGSYNVSITDMGGCTISDGVTITEQVVLNVSITANNVSCNGACDGDAAATVSGGATPYTYSWNTTPTQTTSTATGLCPGTYTVTVTDNNNCQAVNTISITEPPLLSGTTVKTDIDCGGNCNGSIDLTPSGGTLPYSFLWSNGATTEDIFNLCAGTYTVTVTDNNGCPISFTDTITEPPPLSATILSSTNAICFGNCDGSADLTVSGGLAPYTYSWTNGSTNQDPIDLCAGTNTVTVTDANGCQTSTSVTISEPPLLFIDLLDIVNPPSCGGVNNGEVEVIIAGGTPGYTYLWSDGQTTDIAIDLVAGFYTVTITDASGCTIDSTFVLNEDAAPILSISSQTNVSCYGGNDGSVSISVTGGSPPYTHLWNTGATTSSLSNLTSGVYTDTVTDNALCRSLIQVTITQPDSFSTTIIGTLTGCSVCNGTADLTVSGGTIPYTYNWSNGATTQDISGLCTGTYTVTVTDASLCQIMDSVQINQSTDLSSTISGINVSCFGGSDGSVDLTVTGGTSPYSYIWEHGATTEDLTNIPAGNYAVTVTDVNGCITTNSITVTEPLQLTSSIIVTDVSCNGSNDGSADLTVSGGTAPYTYLWSTGDTTQDLIAIPAGAYTVSITDANGCTTSDTATINEPPLITLSTSSTNATCGDTNGTASVSATGGIAPYTYQWDDLLLQTTDTATGLAAGTYTVTVTDNNGCTASISVIVNNDIPVVTITASANVSCNGVCDGTAATSVSGGVLPYIYSWDNGETTSTAIALCAGLRTVLVTDSNNCITSASVTITEPALLTTSIITTDVSCNGNSDGAADLTVSGGTLPYTYLWSTGDITQDITGLLPGTYTVTVTDSNNCIVNDTAMISEPAILTTGVIGTEVSCNGGSDGAADLTVSGGTLPFTYLWSTGDITQDLIGIPAGTYTVSITDANSCTANDTVTISESTALITNIISTNVNCKGGSDGYADLNVSGGTIPYSYLWSSGNITQDLLAIPAGTYIITVTDANGCTANDTVIISEPPALAISIAAFNVSCNGTCNGAADLTVAGGIIPYTYSWSNGATTQDISGLCAGTYIVDVSDSNGCIASDTVTISEPSALVLIMSSTDAACGACDGTASVIVTGGTPGFTYIWSSGGTGDTDTGLCAGTYCVVVTDAAGCIDSNCVGVNNIGGTALTYVFTDVTCNGDSDGSINLTVSGGTPPFTYSWSNGANTEDISSLPANAYTVTVTDSNNCITSETVTINEPAAIITSISSTGVSCNGSNDGSATVSASGGTGAYAYLWNDPGAQSTATAAGLSSGTYIVIVTDSNGCIAFDTVIITEPTILNAIITSSTDISCNGGSDGMIDLTITGGMIPYSYIWSSGATTEDLINIPAGSYSVTVTDANGCTASDSVVINEPNALLLSASSTNANCGDSNGVAIVAVSGGVSPYIYQWNDPMAQTNDTAAGLSVGLYTITVADNNGCIAVDTVMVNNDVPVATITAIFSASCNGLCDGTATVSASGGVTPYAYLWDNGETTATAIALCAGNRTVTVTDSNNCIAADTVTINEPTAINITILSSADVSCNGGNDGSIDITVSGGTPPYTYSWSNGATTEDISSLSAGTYSVIIMDSNNCTANEVVIISEPVALILTTSGTDVSCYGACDGSVSVSVSGGTVPYTYSWNPSCSIFGAPTCPGSCAGTYNVIVTDLNGCTGTDSVTINEPPALSTSIISSTDVSCNGGNDGAANLIVTGGTSPYSYLWSNGSTAEDLGGISAGSYTVDVTDSNGCLANDTVVISEPAALVLTMSATDATCDSSDGSAAVSVTGGIPGYTYLWNDSLNQTTATVTGLGAGIYTVIVTDSNGCVSSNTVGINNTGAPFLSYIPTDVTCNAGNNGSIDLTISGGTPPFGFFWSNGETTEDINNLAAGTYSVTVVDSNNCLANEIVIINEPPVLISNITSSDVNCNGWSDGNAFLTVTGGTLPYSFNWSNGDTIEDIINLTGGMYSVIITDSNGCNIYDTVLINEPAAITTNIVKVNILCYGDSTGFADLTVTGGTLPYSYSWSNGAAIQDISNLPAGNYYVVITDGMGCTANDSITIEEPLALNAVVVSTNVSCNSGNNGIADLTVSGGIAPYAYFWSNFTVTEDLTGLSVGTYEVIVTDSNGCTISATVSITEPPALVVNTSASNISCNSLCDGIASAIVSGGILPYTWSWNTTPVQTTATITGVCAGKYFVTVTDGNACIDSASIILFEPDALSLAVGSVNATCGNSNGEAYISSLTGGTVPYTFLWNDPGAQITDTATDLAAGTYTITVTDSNGCADGAVVSVNDAGTPNALITTSNNVSCNGNNDGSATVTVIGGTLPYSYQWNDPANQITATVTGLGAGTFSVFVTDSNGCTGSDSVVISEPPTITIVADSILSPTPGNNNGAIILTVSGGATPYSFSWSNGDTTQNLFVIGAGTYTIIITDANGCIDSASFTVTEVTGMNQFQVPGFGFQVYPNPATGYITLQIVLPEKENINIEIWNVFGVNIYTNSLYDVENIKKEVDLSKYANGVYFVKLVVGEKVMYKRVVIAK